MLLYALTRIIANIVRGGALDPPMHDDINGKYSIAVYDKQDELKLSIFMFQCGPAYGVYISQIVRIGRICSEYSDFALRHYKLTE